MAINAVPELLLAAPIKVKLVGSLVPVSMITYSFPTTKLPALTIASVATKEVPTVGVVVGGTPTAYQSVLPIEEIV